MDQVEHGVTGSCRHPPVVRRGLAEEASANGAGVLRAYSGEWLRDRLTRSAGATGSVYLAFCLAVAKWNFESFPSTSHLTGVHNEPDSVFL